MLLSQRDTLLVHFIQKRMMDYSCLIGERRTILDVGCGDKRYYKHLPGNITSVDAWEKAKPDHLINLAKFPLPFEEKSFDFVLMLDFIEHLEKHTGEFLLRQARKIARNEVIVLTPTIWNDNKQEARNPESWYYKNPYNSHKSLWTVEDFSGWEIHQPGHLLRNFIIATWSWE